jgi:SH3-like domain-containing protein
MTPSTESLGSGLEPVLNILNAQNTLKTLSNEEIPVYLSSLKSRLDNLGRILQEEKRDYAVSFLDMMSQSAECFLYKYHDVLQGDDKIDFPLTIDPRISGLPTVKDFYLLEKNKNDAAAMLEQLPPRAEIIDMIRRAIFRDDSVANGQNVYARSKFYTKLASSTILPSYQILSMKKVNEKNGRDYYSIEWCCIEKGSNFPMLYRVLLTQEDRFPALQPGSNPRLETVLYQSQGGTANLAGFASLIDREIEEVHPKMVERYKIGPFMSKFTNNCGLFEELLSDPAAGTDLEDHSMLKFTVERVVSEKVSQYGNAVDFLLRRKTEREVFGPVDSETKLITAFRIKQKIGSKDENGFDCRVYGVTAGGEIV